ncbi:ATP-binding protein [Microbacterium sp. 179-B 1A2 NHS]|uniref:ATP-binding protein n=1 Tax=Microbacterium sp. 179-B 1A2 NHS TaxID=3142383 RepID=UPI0039A3C96D
MTTRETDADSGTSSRGRPLWFWIATPVVIMALGVFGTLLQAPGLEIAAWWPATGVSLWFILRARSEHRPWVLVLTFVATAAANAVGGRSVLLCLTYGALNTLEIAVVLSILRAWRAPFRLDSVARAFHLVVAVLFGAMVTGVTISLTGVIVLGTPFFGPAVVAFASHASAMTLIAPFAVLPPHRAERVALPELILQTVSTAMTILLAFGPGANTPLAFLVFAALAWGALRFPIEIALTESLVVAVAVLGLILATEGRSGGTGFDAIETAIVLVTFMGAVGIFTVLVVASRYEGRVDASLAVQAAQDRANAERERAATLSMQLDLERQREDFVTATSHELRTPATNILGYSELLVGADLPDDEADWARAVHRSATRLKSLLDDLHHSVATTDAPAQALSVDDLIAEVRSTHLPDADSAGTTIATPPPTQLVADANSADARRALGSLVSNAVKFSARGTVTISASRQGDCIVISVDDDGPGMTAETLANAFERFYRGAEAEARSSAGMGLGLANARELAQRNRGDVRLESAPGRGVRASLILPAAHREDAVAP